MNDEATISTENYWNLFDVLGMYYHQWQFDGEMQKGEMRVKTICSENRILELDRVANRLGFHKFMDGIGLGGDFQKMTTSRRTADIVRVSKRRKEPESVGILDKTTDWAFERIPEEAGPPVMLKVFCEFEKVQM